MTILQQISEKKIELNNLKEQYNNQVEAEKMKVLNGKSKGINKSLYLLSFEFESSCGRTPQYLEFYKVFKKEFGNVLKPYISKIEFSKPNHFDVTGFFELNDKRVYYFSIGDLRWDKGSILIRTATSFKDYTGGRDEDVELDEDFVDNLMRVIK